MNNKNHYICNSNRINQTLSTHHDNYYTWLTKAQILANKEESVLKYLRDNLKLYYRVPRKIRVTTMKTNATSVIISKEFFDIIKSEFNGYY